MSRTRRRDGHGPVPIIDIAPFTAGQTPGRAQVVDTVRAACEDTGFFVITGHGFPEALATQIYDASRTFFDLPAEEKNAIGETGPVPGGLMHFAIGEEALAATLGQAAIGDLKETLDYGPGFFGDRWPAKPPDLKPAWRAYYEAMSALAATLRSIFAAALGLDPDYFEDRFQGHLSSLRVDENTESEAVPTLIRPWSPSKSRQLPCPDVVASLGVLAPLRIDQNFASGSIVYPTLQAARSTEPCRKQFGSASTPIRARL